MKRAWCRKRVTPMLLASSLLPLLFLLPSHAALLLVQAAPTAKNDDAKQPLTYRLEGGVLIRVDIKSGEAPGPIEGVRVKLPRLTHSVDPAYPAKEERGRGGVCELSVLVGLDGKPHDIVVVTSLSPAYDGNAIAAIAKYRFKPALLDGRAMAMKIKVEMNFQII